MGWDKTQMNIYWPLWLWLDHDIFHQRLALLIHPLLALSPSLVPLAVRALHIVFELGTFSSVMKWSHAMAFSLHLVLP